MTQNTSRDFDCNYGFELMLQARFQHGHGLQVCFMNEQLLPSSTTNQIAAAPEAAQPATQSTDVAAAGIVVTSYDDNSITSYLSAVVDRQ